MDTGTPMNTDYRRKLPGTNLDYFDARAAVEAIRPGSYDQLPYTSKVLAEQLVRRCEPEILADALGQLVERRRDLDFPWYPARVVCHDILGQTALVDSPACATRSPSRAVTRRWSTRWCRPS
jgi:2-methylcitrate dehydratase (2-methyl-trans-aconitate forming)